MQETKVEVIAIIRQMEQNIDSRFNTIEQRLIEAKSEEFLTIREACEYLRMSRTKFNEMKNEGLIKVAKVKGRIITKKSELTALVESMMVDNSPQRA